MRSLEVSLNTETTHPGRIANNSMQFVFQAKLCIIHFSEICFNILPTQKISTCLCFHQDKVANGEASFVILVSVKDECLDELVCMHSFARAIVSRLGE